MNCLFATDLHGNITRYRKLLDTIGQEKPEAVFLGGDLLPHGFGIDGPHADFIEEYLAPEFLKLKENLDRNYPRVFMIPGNDDPRIEEQKLLRLEQSNIWSYAHRRTIEFGPFSVLGYALVPPTPFLLKDWERYDVSRYVDPGCVSPEKGHRSIEVPANETRYRTIQKDLESLTANLDMANCICLFHSPPHKTSLDRADLDGKMVDHVPLDVNVGSIAIRRFIEERQPLLTLHGHIHESTRLTGSWRDRIGRTHMFNAAHEGPELALVRFDPEDLDGARRELI